MKSGPAGNLFFKNGTFKITQLCALRDTRIGDHVALDT